MPADIGICFHREEQPAAVAERARAAEASGFDEFWVIEDCFYTSGPTLAAAALTATTTIGVGIGIMPSVARNAAVTAMEIATLAGLAPGRFHAGIGHGVQDWMGQMHARVASPIAALDETLAAVQALLAGDTVSVSGRYVSLSDVALEVVPQPKPLVSAGVRGPKSLEVSARRADGTILADFCSPAYVTWARQQLAAGGGENQRTTVFCSAAVAPDGDAMRDALAPHLAEVCEHPPLSLRMAPFWDELSDRAAASSWLEAVRAMPKEWWDDIAPIGTPDDAAGYLSRLTDAGVDSLALFPSPFDPIGDTEYLGASVLPLLG